MTYTRSMAQRLWRYKRDHSKYRSRIIVQVCVSRSAHVEVTGSINSFLGFGATVLPEMMSEVMGQDRLNSKVPDNYRLRFEILIKVGW